MTNELGQLGRYCFLLCFLFWMSWPLAAAPSAAPISVREALEDRDKNGIPDLLGETLPLQGFLISDPTLSKDSRASAVYLQDGSGGIRLQAADNTLVTTGLGRGDTVQVHGVMQQAQGRNELQIAQIRRIGHGNVPPPRKVRVADLLRGQYLGELVELQGQLLVPPDLEGNADGFQLRDESGRIRIFARSRFFRNEDFAERLRKAGNVELVGIVEQHTTATGNHTGYSVHPRDLADFHFPPVLSYQTMAMGGALVSLLWVLFHFSVRRRAAERQAREVASWSENLQRSEAALRESNQKLGTLVRSSPLAIVALDTQGAVQAWNPAAEQMFGWSEPEVLGRTLPTVSQWAPPVCRTHTESVSTGKVLLAKDVQAERKDGSLFIARISLSPLYNGDSHLHGCMAVIEDITVQKKAEDELRASEAKYRSLITNIPSVTWTGDERGNTTFISPNVEPLYGYTPEEIYQDGDRVWLGRIHPEDAERVKEAYANLFQKKEKFDVEYRIQRKDGTWIWLRDRAVGTYQKDGVTYADGLFSDITERKQLQSQLLQAQKMEAIGRLAGGVAHDFNNLLNVISGYSELLLDHVKETEPLGRYAEEIRKAAYRGASLTRQLLAFSRKQVLEPKVLDLNEVIHEMEKMLRRLIGEDIQFDTALSSELGWVKADPGQIEQVLMNLAVNSRDAMLNGGHLTIETSNVELGEGCNRLGTDCPPGSYVLIAVSDTGVGMTAETRAHLFEPFFTTKPRGQGTGLGLATVYGIVKQSGGCIAVSSKPGQGATFRIYLPRVETPSETSSRHETEPATPRGSETILLVEDEPAVRELAREFLEASGYQVLDAGGGTAAVELLQKHPGAIQLLLTDVIMPGMSGRELADRLTALRPGLKVLFMSGYTDNEIARQGVLEEGTHLLQKPFTRSVLAAKVRELLEEGAKS